MIKKFFHLKINAEKVLEQKFKNSIFHKVQSFLMYEVLSLNIWKAIFSLEGVKGLLYKYDIIVK